MINVSTFDRASTFENYMSVSVIIPFYNSIKYLDRAVKSCLIQDEVSQLILVDDGSTEKSYEIAQVFAQKDPRIIFARHNKNRGRSAARNTGMGLVNQELTAFLDADDYFLPGRFISIKRLKEHSQVVGMYCDVQSEFEDDQYRHYAPFGDLTGVKDKIPDDQLFEYLVLGESGHISIIGCVFRSAVIRNYSFDENLSIGEDTDFLWNVSHSNVLVKDHNESKVIRCVHGANTYFDQKKVLENKVRLYRKWWARAGSMKLSKKVSSKILRSYIYYSTFKRDGAESSKVSKYLKLIQASINHPTSVLRLI